MKTQKTLTHYTTSQVWLAITHILKTLDFISFLLTRFFCWFLRFFLWFLRYFFCWFLRYFFHWFLRFFFLWFFSRFFRFDFFLLLGFFFRFFLFGFLFRLSFFFFCFGFLLTLFQVLKHRFSIRYFERISSGVLSHNSSFNKEFFDFHVIQDCGISP